MNRSDLDDGSVPKKMIEAVSSHFYWFSNEFRGLSVSRRMAKISREQLDKTRIENPDYHCIPDNSKGLILMFKLDK